MPAMPVADCLMAKHPEAREHDVSHDQEEDDPHNPTSPAARSPAKFPATSAAKSAATVAAPATSVSAVSPVSAVSAGSAVSAPNTTSAAMHHEEIVRVPGRRRFGATCEFPENGHGRMQTARASAL